MNTSFKKISEKLLDVRIFIFLVPFSWMRDRGMGKWGVALMNVRIFCHLFYGWNTTELMKRLILLKIWMRVMDSELSLSRTGSGLALAVRIREVSAL